jgi:3-deoxy-D-manno-octulosonate 8-phosphate phosphatase (KDO 8-P phosphatase)
MKGKPKLSRARWARIRLFAMDVDGILTDGGVYVSSDGSELKRFHIPDGLGLGLLRDRGLPLAWISGRASGATTRRAAELRIPHVIQGRQDKLAALTELAGQLGFSLPECVYMGDDIIDAAALAAAGIGVCVCDLLLAAGSADRGNLRRKSGTTRP